MTVDNVDDIPEQSFWCIEPDDAPCIAIVALIAFSAGMIMASLSPGYRLKPGIASNGDWLMWAAGIWMMIGSVLVIGVAKIINEVVEWKRRR